MAAPASSRCRGSWSVRRARCRCVPRPVCAIVHPRCLQGNLIMLCATPHLCLCRLGSRRWQGRAWTPFSVLAAATAATSTPSGRTLRLASWCRGSARAPRETSWWQACWRRWRVSCEASRRPRATHGECGGARTQHPTRHAAGGQGALMAHVPSCCRAVVGAAGTQRLCSTAAFTTAASRGRCSVTACCGTTCYRARSGCARWVGGLVPHAEEQVLLPAKAQPAPPPLPFQSRPWRGWRGRWPGGCGTCWRWRCASCRARAASRRSIMPLQQRAWAERWSWPLPRGCSSSG